MSGAGDHTFGVHSVGWRGEQRLWRVYWIQRPGMHAEHTGPRLAGEAMIKAYVARERLNWREDR